MGKKTLTIGQQIKNALDGRSQRWLSLRINMPESDLSKKLKGKAEFTVQEIGLIEKQLNFKANVN